MTDETQFDAGRFGGVIAKQEILEALCKQKINPNYYLCEPVGGMIHVVEEEVPRSYGGIELPGKAEGKMGVGWVLAAGPLAGKPTNALNQGPLTDNPQDLLYLHVIMGSTTGMPLRLSILDTRFTAQVFVMLARDLKSIDWNEGTMKERAEQPNIILAGEE